MSEPDFVNSLARGLNVLGCFEKGHQKMTLTQVAARTDLTRGTARRFLLTLCTLGFVATDGKLFWLTPKVLKFSSDYLSTFGLGEAANAIIQKVTDTLNESSSMAVLDGDEIVYVARVEKQSVYSNSIEVGTRLPVHTTSMGLVLLAGLSEDEFERWLEKCHLTKFTKNSITDKRKLKRLITQIRKDGYAINDGGLEIGVRSISVPILDREQKVIAAINVATLAARTSLEQMENQFLPVLRDAARKISMVLGVDN